MGNRAWTTNTFGALGADDARRINVGVRSYNEAHIPELQLALSRVPYALAVDVVGADTSPGGGYPGNPGRITYHTVAAPLGACEVKALSWHGLMVDSGDFPTAGVGIWFATWADGRDVQVLTDWFDLTDDGVIDLTNAVDLAAGARVTLCVQVQNTKVARGTATAFITPTSVPSV